MREIVGLKIPYEPAWERAKSITGWKRHMELADFLKVTSATVSGARKRDSFPVQWAFKIAQVYDCSTDWILTGRGDEEVKTEELPRKQEIEPTPAAVAEETSEDGSVHSQIPGDTLGLGESVELLARIYNSGNTVLIRAIAANLHAFSEAVDNKALAQKAIDMMDEMNKRMLTMEKDLAKLKEENEELKKKPPGSMDQALG